MDYSIVENNVVVNIAVADAPLADNWHEGNHGIGATYDPATESFTPLPPVIAEPVVPGVPQSVARRQAKQALALRGKLALVQPAIDAIADPVQRELMQIEWDDSQEFQRNRQSIILIGTAIGFSSVELDDLFTFAATL